ncbi:MAG TPA: hypothetical protein DCL06_02205 [Corynebacterium variabile]|uniref:Uncharacterized protein n=1 Tax=Corynebacterium variabile TaxID=1727 RepID=A0A3B9QT82_9CORY|nr:hypothetical protein [Corynebacterium variabile]
MPVIRAVPALSAVNTRWDSCTEPIPRAGRMKRQALRASVGMSTLPWESAAAVRSTSTTLAKSVRDSDRSVP